MATLIGNMSPIVNKLKKKFFPRNCILANTNATIEQIPTAPTVVATITIKEFFSIFQKVEVLRIEMILSQLGGLGMEYGCEYICPVVFTLPKSKITMGMKIIIAAMTRKAYTGNL